MANHLHRIEPLPVEAQLQLQSSATFNSLNDVVIGLIKNSLDAQARNIQIEIDYPRGNCCVEDDGTGIPGIEFEARGRLGLMHSEESLDRASQVKLLTVRRT
jgi:DNA mismatch repair protein MLH3